MEITNPDSRLRPSGTPLLQKGLPDATEKGDAKPKAAGYLVDARNFPDFYKEAGALFQLAGLKPIPIIIQLDTPKTPEDESLAAGGMILAVKPENRSHDSIRIGLTHWNHSTYDELLFNVAHEISHRWRHLHPNTKPFVPPIPFPKTIQEVFSVVPPAHWRSLPHAKIRELDAQIPAFIRDENREVEADVLALNLTGDLASAVKAIQHLKTHHTDNILDGILDIRIRNLQHAATNTTDVGPFRK